MSENRKVCGFNSASVRVPPQIPQGVLSPRGLIKSKFTPTDEQFAILDAFSNGASVVVRALAGSGKTASLRLIAERNPRRPMTYVAFNAAIAAEARATFPSNVMCKTMHAFAYAAEGHRYKDRLDGGHVPPHRVVTILRLPERFEFGDFSLRSFQLVSLINESVKRFCSSNATTITGTFIPKVPGLDTPAARSALSDMLTPFLVRAWADLIQVNGQLRFSPSVYLKLYGMGNPVLPGNVILYDEAQDATPVTRSIVERQASQLVVVGDEFQQLYEWNGAVDSLDYFEVPDENKLSLTKSFRFGPAIANEANLILELLQSSIFVTGNDAVDSSLAYLDDPEAVLCRTNAEAVARLLAAQAAGVSAGLVGGTAAVESLAKAALDLSAGRRTSHPEFLAFDSWAQIVDYVESDSNDARDLQVLVSLVNRYGAEKILAAVQRSVPVAQAHLKISTVHKSKGLEYRSVLVAGDFASPFNEEGDYSPEDLRLAYVAITRAQHYLDTSNFDWLRSAASSSAVKLDVERVFLPASAVPSREIVTVLETSSEQVICDPNDKMKLVFRNTKYDQSLVAAQRDLPQRRYYPEYNGDMRVNTCLACVEALQVAEQFGLTISLDAQARVDSMKPVF